MLAGRTATISDDRTTVGPGSSHHAGGVLLCHPTWKVPWLAPIRALGLLLVAGAAKVTADVGVGGASLHRLARDAQWPALVLAVYVAVHPFLLRWQFGRVRAGKAVEIAWAGRHRSGQPWLVLRSPTGRAWRALPRQGPVEYPLPRWRGTPWIYPPALDAVRVRGTLVRPRWTWRHGLVLHRPDDAPGVELVGGREVLPFGSDPAGCLGVHLRAAHRIRGRRRLRR
jgi:hypothetical protein